MFDKVIQKERFFPSFISVFINYNYFCRKALMKSFGKYFGKLNGKMMDLGCGSQPYKSMFKNVSQYIGVDVENEAHPHVNENIDIFYDGKNLPFESNEFDSVLTSEVLEHVPNVEMSLSEIFRVLKPGGYLMASIPFVYPEHEMPYDFRRLTVNGFKQILEEFNFEIIGIEKNGSFIEAITQLIMIYVHDLLYTKNLYVNMIVNILFISPICMIGILFTRLLPSNKRLYLGTTVFAQKKTI